MQNKEKKNEANEVENRRDCRMKKKRRDKHRGEYWRKKWEKQT